ncbi:MAG: glycosyltransferase family 2 protein [Clostridia bacterium]|nr:glycosyltransferase family 2 protein [Clostridia bacterium]
MTEFTFLMPCLNEAEALRFCIDEAKSAIERLELDAEILVADNGSSDNSVQIALENGARVTKVKARGYGSAIIGGINAAKGEYIIMGDCDGSYDFAHPDLFVSELRKGAALVMGNRFEGGIEKGAMPPSHKIGIPLLSALARWRFKTDVYDFHCGLRGFDRKTAAELDLACHGMEFATEMIARFAQSGAVITQIPTTLRCDKRSGGSHIRTVRDGFRHLKFILFDNKKTWRNNL